MDMVFSSVYPSLNVAMHRSRLGHMHAAMETGVIIGQEL